jgi:hypothetical protein
MTVSEYVTHFTQLSRYAPNDVDTNEKKQECFLNGLEDGLAYAFEAWDFKNFQTMVDKALGSRIGEEHYQASTSSSVKFNRTPTLGPTSKSILRLLDLSSALSHRVLNRCLNLLDKDLPTLSNRWFHALTFFKLQTLGIKVAKEPQPLRMHPQIKWTPLASILARRVIMLTVAPVNINHPLQLQERLHHQAIMKALPWPKLNRTTLKEK